jgi:hypothetical protein
MDTSTLKVPTMTHIDRLSKNLVSIVRPGPNRRTVVIKHPDGSTQVQFKSLLTKI